jgi:hypothetical protein
MARKRPAPKYAGALAQPIYVEDYYKARGLGQPNRERDIAAIRKRAVEKMWLLFEHYKIDPSDEHSWQELAMSLAVAHVPGLQFAKRPKRGRKSTWKTGLGDEWVRAVDDVKSRTGKGTKEVIAELRDDPKWHGFSSKKPGGRKYSAQNLEARYWETRTRQKAFASLQKKLASLQKDWEKGIVFGVDLVALFATAAPLGRPHEVTGRTTKIRAKTSRRKLAHAQKRSR